MIFLAFPKHNVIQTNVNISKNTTNPIFVEMYSLIDRSSPIPLQPVNLTIQKEFLFIYWEN